MIHPYPAFHRLVRTAGTIEIDSTDLQWHLGYLSEQYFLDLLTWYHLAWLGHSLAASAAGAAADGAGEDFFRGRPP